MSLKKTFKSLYSKRTLVYTASVVDDYMTARSKLDAMGIPCEVKTKRSNQNFGSEWSNLDNPVTYEIYVKSEDERRARKAINNK